MELSLAWLPFEREALRRAELLDVGGVNVPVAVAEDLVVYKAVAWRERDRTDIERLLRAHAGDIDLAYVRRIIAEFAEALDELDRIDDFERLVARTLPPRGAPR
jgi:predicted nucleotidyltransferase